MITQAPRVLYIPNEAGDFRQLGFRRPLEDMRSAGLVEEYDIVSLQMRLLKGESRQEVFKDLLDRARQLKPTVIFAQHLGSTRINSKALNQLREISSSVFFYHEADPYSRFKHPLPRAARAAGKAADIVYTVGSGVFAENFKRAGATDVRWVPHVFESDRFEFVGRRSSDFRHDVVMIANRNTPRFRGLPNWRDRISFVEYMQNRFGTRFAIYGRGWVGPSARGPVDFSEQHVAIRSGRISANWDHFATEPHYYSNRLPISLSVGSIHATGWHPGYDDIFGEAESEFLLFATSFERLADSIEATLELGDTELERRGALAQTYAYGRCRQDDQFVDMLNGRHQLIRPDAAREAWRSGAVVPEIV